MGSIFRARAPVRSRVADALLPLASLGQMTTWGNMTPRAQTARWQPLTSIRNGGPQTTSSRTAQCEPHLLETKVIKTSHSFALRKVARLPVYSLFPSGIPGEENSLKLPS